MRLKRILIIGTIFPVLFSIVLFFGILISGEDDDSSNSYSPVYSGMNLSADVLKHQPMVEKYARENGISEYVNVLLAIIQVESGGSRMSGTDIVSVYLSSCRNIPFDHHCPTVSTNHKSFNFL